MAMLKDTFVNLGVGGSYESAEGIGDVSFSGVRNYLKHDWPQMDIGQIEFYNPAVATDEVARNRRLTRNQAYWLARQIAGFINTLDIPSEEDFKTFGYGSGELKDAFVATQEVRKMIDHAINKVTAEDDNHPGDY